MNHRVQADPPALPPPTYVAPPDAAQLALLLHGECVDLPLSEFTCPADNPVLPAGADTFTPSLTGTLSPASPAIADFTKQAGPGNAFVLQGGAFDSGSQVWCYTQTTPSDAFTNTVTLKQAVPVGAPQTLTAIAPTGNYGMTLAWVQNSDSSFSAPVRLNAPQVWWISQEQVGRGASLSLYGRNLSYRNGTATSYVYVRPWGAAATVASSACTISAVNPYRVDVKLPLTVTTGDYEVWLHNGHGGIYGWSGPMRVSVVTTDPNYGWSTATSTLTPGANIQTALNSAVAGQTVMLGTGTFTLTGPLTIPAGIQLSGAGQTSTYIQLAPTYTGGGNVILMKPGRTRISDV